MEIQFLAKLLVGGYFVLMFFGLIVLPIIFISSLAIKCIIDTWKDK